MVHPDAPPRPISPVGGEHMLSRPPGLFTDALLPVPDPPVQVEVQTNGSHAQVLDLTEHHPAVIAADVVVVGAHPQEHVRAPARVDDLSRFVVPGTEERHIPPELLGTLERVIVPAFEGFPRVPGGAQQDHPH